METWSAAQLASGGAFVFLSYDGEVVIERGYLKSEDKPTRERGTAELTGADAQKKIKPLHSEKLCRRLTAHRTAAVQVELAAQPGVALAVLMYHMIPTIFPNQYGYGSRGRTLEAQFTSSRDKLLREADDMADSRAWQQIDAERAKWSAMLPTKSADLLPWLLQQSDDVTSNLFAYCVAATLDSVSGTDSAHPVNALRDVLNLDMTKYWTATQASYLNHVSKGRISEVVTAAAAVSADAAAPLASKQEE